MKKSHPWVLFLVSVRRYLRLVTENKLHLRRDHFGKTVSVSGKGTYAVFRETESETESEARYVEEPVVLIVGFRLKCIRSNPFFHAVFQRIYIITTPFWSGFYGMHIKLWMVDLKMQNYLGIYEWYRKTYA